MGHLKTIYFTKLQLMRTECICLRDSTQRHMKSASPSPEASLYLSVWSSSVPVVKKTGSASPDTWNRQSCKSKLTNTVSTKPVGPAFHLSASYDIKYPI